MNDILLERRSIIYNLRNNSGFTTYNVNTMRYGVDTIHHLGPKIWNSLPLSIKAAHDLKEFKNLIKSLTPEHVLVDFAKNMWEDWGIYRYISLPR